MESLKIGPGGIQIQKQSSFKYIQKDPKPQNPIDEKTHEMQCNLLEASRRRPRIQLRDPLPKPDPLPRYNSQTLLEEHNKKSLYPVNEDRPEFKHLNYLD